MAGRDELIRRLEEVGLATWPALEIERCAGWDLRAAAGVTKRSNSVSPLGPAALPLDEAVARCERWYADRSLPPSFRLTELANPGLERQLADRGYVPDPWVEVMTRPVAHPMPPPDVHIDERPSNEWFARFMERRFEPGSSRTVVSRMLGRRTAPTVFASIRNQDGIVALGIGAVHDGHVAVHAMHTVVGNRRQGLGRRLLEALLAWGAAHGARTAFLQVHSGTPGARALYEAAGFEPAYRYWYRIGG